MHAARGGTHPPPHKISIQLSQYVSSQWVVIGVVSVANALCGLTLSASRQGLVPDPNTLEPKLDKSLSTKTVPTRIEHNTAVMMACPPLP